PSPTAGPTPEPNLLRETAGNTVTESLARQDPVFGSAEHGGRFFGCGLAGAVAGEGFGELGQVAGGVVGCGGHTEVGAVEPAVRVVAVGAQQVVPDQREQPEVHVTDTGPFEMMETVPLVERQHVLERPNPVVGVRVL